MRTVDPARGQHILETAARLFASGRYHEVRMEDVAQAAGVAKGTIYRYFRDKEDLYLGLILSGGNRLYDEVQADIARTDDAEEKLLIYVNASLRFFERYPYFLELVQRVETTGAADKVKAIQQSRQRFFTLIADIIAALAATGHYATSDPDLAALALSGMIRQILRFQPQPFRPGLAPWIVRQFLHGLAAQQAKNGRHWAEPRRSRPRAAPSRA